MTDALTTFSGAERIDLVAEANLAPSVHNIQPTRFRFAADGAIEIHEDTRRRIPVGDPTGADNRKSFGAAAEGLVMALAARNISASIEAGDDALARIIMIPEAEPDPLREHVPRRATWRGAFGKRTPDDIARLETLATSGDMTVVTDAPRIAEIATLYDDTSLATLRDNAYRAELVSWMRLSRSAPAWSRDGLNAEAMALSPFEAFAAGLAMGPSLFPVLDGIGVARPLIAEGGKVKSAAGVVLFHRPASENDFDTGRRFYRAWLEITALGLCLCPMSVLADAPTAAAQVKQAFGIAADRKLVTVFRVGRRPDNAKAPTRVRLPPSELIV
jgi:hypothetical protein